jgi:hypothetical protein
MYSWASPSWENPFARHARSRDSFAQANLELIKELSMARLEDWWAAKAVVYQGITHHPTIAGFTRQALCI